MVITVQQARQQLTQQQQVLTQARTQIERTTLPPITVAELRARGRAEILQRESQERQLQSAKQRELTKLKPAEQQLVKAEKEIVRVEEAIREQERQRAAFNKALDVFASKRPEAIFGLTKLERKFFQQISAGRQTAVKIAIEEATKKLEEKGVTEIKPVFEPGKILPVGVTGIKFETVTPTRIITEPPKSELARIIKEQTPDIKFVPQVVEDIIGQVSGLEKFSRGKFSGTLAGLQDIEGRKIFSPVQAGRIADLSFEVVENYLLGRGIGKLFVLGRGAFLATLPKVIKESSKFKKLTQVIDVSLLAGLGTAEAIRIGKVVKTEGLDEAILETIGLVSFGVGFSRAGLKADPQAEADFRKFADRFKELGKEKRAELRIRKKRKKGEIQVLEQLTPEDVEKTQAVISEIEKRLLREPDIKEQLKILAELKKRVKTPQAKKNFDEFVLTLIEKDILKIPEREIIPGVRVKEIPGVPVITEITKPPFEVAKVAKPPFEVAAVGAPVAVGSLINRQRITKANILNKARVDVSTIQKDIALQRNKITTLVAQKASTIVLQKERLKLQVLQKERLKLITKVTQVSKLKLTQVLKGKPAFPRPRPRPPRRLRIPPPFFLLKKVKPLKRKLIKVALKKGGYDVFVKSKGKFKRVNINPLGKKKAHDLGSWLVDRSTARTWKRKQVPFKAQKPILKVPSAYFKKTRIKYRGRKIKGKIQPLINLGIEKRKFAIDTKREKQQLSAARVRAELLRKAGLKKPRKRPLGLRATKLIKFKRT